MKHIPILFSTEMVQAILEGRKKMTRRTKGIPDLKADDYKCFDMGGGWYFFERNKYSFDRREVKAPYSIGDILWVRESFCIFDPDFCEYAYKTDIVFPTPKKWRPSIHMPKEACRIFLKVTDVRCERLHEITEQDAVDEGVDTYPVFSAYDDFRSLWAKINGQSSWDANPYVWGISFERCDRPSDFLPSQNK